MSCESASFLRPINRHAGIRAGWVERVPGISVAGDRDMAMRALRPAHEAALRSFGGDLARWWRAEQVHGNRVAVVPDALTREAPDGLPVVPDVDGLITADPGAVLAVYVADCGPIWLADPVRRVVGLLHSGRKGTEENILEMGLNAMARRFGCDPGDVVAVLGPCIRPPDYETDFAAAIGRQAAEAGVGEYTDCGLNTAADLDRHYSYRKELGQTGRMMAMITIDPLP